MNTRIKQIVDYKQMSPAQFAEAIEISRSSLTHIFSGRNQPSLDVARKILTTFPDITPEWLIMGAGKMLTSGESPNLSTISPEPVKQKEKAISQPVSYQLFPDLEDEEENLAAETIEPERPEEKAEEVLSEEAPATLPPPVTPPVIPSPPTRQKSKNHDQISARRKIIDSPQDKNVVKIVFFYDDMTFESYYPSR